jgi:phosphoserine phosphatase RsbU/P
MADKRKSVQILIVDDDTVTNRMIETILRRAGFKTLCAFDAASARLLIHEKNPDLILLDVSLPDGNGFDICRQLQSEQGASRTPVLFISSHEDVPTKLKGFEAGGVDYITKPVAGAEVIARVTTHLRLKQAYETLAELQAERIQRLAGAQEALMAQPADMPAARFHVALSQVLKAGGDFYDVIDTGNQVFDYLVADASGHDLAASFWTASLKTLFSEYATPVNTVRDILGFVNNALCKILPEGTYFTIVYARLNRMSGKLSLVNCGHPAAIFIPKNGSEIAAIEREGDVVGVFADATFGMIEMSVSPGDRMLLFSDGLIELGGTRDVGMRKLIDCVAENRAAELPSMINETLHGVLDGRAPEDDIVLLGFEV